MLSTQNSRTLMSHVRHTEEESITFRVGGVEALTAMDKVLGENEMTRGSASGSDYSDQSAFEETDEFGKRLLQHQRDVQRLNNALRPGQQAFRKARPRIRSGNRLAQTDGVAETGVGERPGSAESAVSEPAVNPPRQWATKAKPRSEWLRRKHAAAASGLDSDLHRADEGSIMPHVTAYTGDEDWIAVAEEPLDPNEMTPPSMRRRRRESTPSSMQHMNTTINGAEGGEDHDFTAADLLASTPALNRRNRRIDELTRQEIASIEKRGVTKRNLEQILDHTTLKTTEVRPVSAPSGEFVSPPRRRRSLMANKENLPPNGEVHGTYKGAETVGLVNRTAEAVTFKNAQRPAHKRTDSYNLLKKLARVSSLSPSPAKPQNEEVIAAVDKRTKSVPELDFGPLSAKSANSDYLAMARPKSAGAKLAEKIREQESLDHAKEQRLETPSEEAEEQHDDAPPELKIDPPDIDDMPAPQPPARDSKTPLVTGAWLDTPGPTIDLRPLLNTTDSEINRAFGTPSAIATLEPRDDPLGNDGRRIVSEPVLAKSALADVLKDVANEPDLEFGDTTIQSLEDIVDPDTEVTDTVASMDVAAVAQEVIDAIDAADGAASDPLTQAERDRRQERLAIESMNKHLRAARTSIKHANRGLRRVENKIETVQAASTPIAPETIIHITDDGRHVCPACGSHPSIPPHSAWGALWREFTSCFYTLPPASSTTDLLSRLRNIRLTYLGLFCTVWLLWFAVESALCYHYCPVLYADRMVGYGVKEWNPPQFPFVIPTVLFRPWKHLWGPVVHSLGWSKLGVWRGVGGCYGAGGCGSQGEDADEEFGVG
ncbi:hypothetical protein LTR86_002332 [Recurvomyces mirabilis]|nr:hypothetical protein LTR86_002332 [Recurvomyces mirabilis]